MHERFAEFGRRIKFAYQTLDRFVGLVARSDQQLVRAIVRNDRRALEIRALWCHAAQTVHARIEQSLHDGRNACGRGVHQLQRSHFTDLRRNLVIEALQEFRQHDERARASRDNDGIRTLVSDRAHAIFRAHDLRRNLLIKELHDERCKS